MHGTSPELRLRGMGCMEKWGTPARVAFVLELMHVKYNTWKKCRVTLFPPPHYITEWEMQQRNNIFIITIIMYLHLYVCTVYV